MFIIPGYHYYKTEFRENHPLPCTHTTSRGGRMGKGIEVPITAYLTVVVIRKSISLWSAEYFFIVFIGCKLWQSLYTMNSTE